MMKSHCNNRPLAISSFIALLFFAGNRQALATDYSWAAPVSGSVNSPTSWSPNGLPGATDNVLFNLGSAGYTVSFDRTNSNGLINSVQINNDTVTTDLGGIRFSLDGQDFPVFSMGNNSGDVANWTLKNGTFRSITPQGLGEDAIGYAAGSTAIATIDGSAGAAKFRDTAQFVGYRGTGTLNVINGGNVTVDVDAGLGEQRGITGTVNVTGANSTYGAATMTAGENGSGVIAITAGGAMTLSNSLTLADAPGASGSVTVDGTGSNLTVNGLALIGAGGTASLSTTGGATFGAANLSVGLAGTTSGSATFDGTGTAGGISADVTIGTAGSLSIKNGATLISHGTDKVQANGTALGAVTIDGSGSQWTSSALTVNGSLTVQNGGTLKAGTLQNTGNMDIGAGSIVNVTNSILLNKGSLHIDGLLSGAINSIGGIVSGAGTVTGGLVMTGSTVAPGDSPGTLTVGALQIQLPAVFGLAMNSATGTAGGTTGWGLVNSTGILNFMDNGPHDKLTIALESLTSGNQAGLVPDFDPTHDYHWTFITAASTIYGFDPSLFAIDTSHFTNPVYGTFDVSQVGNAIVLNYTAPEPSTWLLGLLGALAALCLNAKSRFRSAE